MKLFTGVATALATPFTNDGKSIDYESFQKLVDEQIKSGVSALVFLGTTGEASTMTSEEKINIVKFAVKHVNKRVPVIVGAGSNSTDIAIKTSVEYEKLGADALLHVSPYYNKATQTGLIEHFTKVAQSTTLPIIIYNVPGRTGVNINASTAKTLSRIPNIIGIKEASGNIEQITEISKFCDENFVLYCGDDALTFVSLCLGAEGVISVASNVSPCEMCEMCNLFFAGNLTAARKKQFDLLPLIKLLFCEVNPIPVKEALFLQKVFKSSFPRLPLTKMTNENSKLLSKLL